MEADGKILRLHDPIPFVAEPGGMRGLMVEEEQLVLDRNNPGTAAGAGLLLEHDDLGLGRPGGVPSLFEGETLGKGEGLGITREGLRLGLLAFFRLRLFAESREEIVEQALDIGGGGSG